MDQPFVTSLFISGIGILILFLALALLYGLMYLMTAVLREHPQAEIGEQQKVKAAGDGGTGPDKQKTVRQRAAVIAVALARAEQELGAGSPVPEVARGTPSPWWMLHQQRQLALNRSPRRSQ